MSNPNSPEGSSGLEGDQKRRDWAQRLAEKARLNPLEGERSVETREFPTRVGAYKLFSESFLDQTPEVVYYPCSESDKSPSAAFPDSKVIYADINHSAVEALQREGEDARVADAEEFDPGKVDVLLMLNPGISPDVPASHVVEGGHVLANNYHGTARELYDNPNYELRGVISGDEEPVLDTDHLEDYFTKVSTNEEFKQTPFYHFAQNQVKKVAPQTEDVLTEYKRIIEMARDQNPEKTGPLILSHEGEQLIIPTELPSKKGNVDDFYVFQKKASDSQVSEVDS